MKNLLFIFGLLLCLSCSKNEMIQSNIQQVKIDQVISLKNRAERKIAYSVLNENEKFTLWQQKLEYVINSKVLSEKQVALINEIKIKLVPSLFEGKSDELEHFKTIYVPQYLNKLKKEFTINQIGQIFYSCRRGEVFEDYDDDGGGGYGTQTRVCNCNQYSMFSCKWLNSSSCLPIRCTAPNPKNDCGFMWLYECNGWCVK